MTGVPRLTLDAAVDITRRHFGISATAATLPSERDQNFLMETAAGARYVLKVANASEDRAVLEAENAALRHLAFTGLSPLLQPTVSGGLVADVGSHMVRLITAFDGVPLGVAPLHTDALRHDVGRALGHLDLALASFEHPASERTLQWDLARADEIVRSHRALVADAAVGAPLDAIVAHYRRDVLPVLPTLRRSLIHADANDYNILVDSRLQSVTGIVDFGDMLLSHTVNEVAIAMAYVALSADDPLAAAAAVLAGYYEVHPLTEPEIACLFGLMGMRLCTSVCLAARQQAERPDVDYLGISQAAIRLTLPQLAAVHPRFAHYVFRDACGLPPVPNGPRLTAWLRDHRERMAPVLGVDLGTTPVAPLDFSAGSPIIAGDVRENEPALLDARVQRVLGGARCHHRRRWVRRSAPDLSLAQ